MSADPRAVVLEREPSGLGEALAVAGAETPSTTRDLACYDVAFVCDRPSLERARAAGVPLCVGVPPPFDLARARALESADLVALAHVELAQALELSAARVCVPGPLPPVGFAPAADRAALRQELSLGDGDHVVLISCSALEAFGATAWLVQLSLLESACVLFDVGADAALAARLRKEVPAHGLDALMFGAGSDAVRAWRAADLAVVTAAGLDIARACGVGLPVLLVEGERFVLDLLVRLGVASVATTSSTVAVELERALEPEARGRAATSVGGFDAARTAGRCLASVAELWRARAASGLPRGLERISHPSSRPAASGPASRPGADDGPDIEAELEALKRQLRDPER